MGSSRFKVGDVCIYVDTANNQLMQNAECMIVECGEYRNGEYICDFPGFKSRARNGYWCCWHRQLRLKRPKAWDSWLTDTSGVKDEGDLPVPATHQGVLHTYKAGS